GARRAGSVTGGGPARAPAGDGRSGRPARRRPADLRAHPRRPVPAAGLRGTARPAGAGRVDPRRPHLAVRDARRRLLGATGPGRRSPGDHPAHPARASPGLSVRQLKFAHPECRSHTASPVRTPPWTCELHASPVRTPTRQLRTPQACSSTRVPTSHAPGLEFAPLEWSSHTASPVRTPPWTCELHAGPVRTSTAAMCELDGAPAGDRTAAVANAGARGRRTSAGPGPTGRGPGRARGSLGSRT